MDELGGLATAHDLIQIRGARENNLRDINLDLPKRLITVFTGVSGSGKSSLVFDTIAAESRRLINETYPAFLQGFMAAIARPNVDVLEGLTTAIVVDQERFGANARSTVGTATDANALLRVLYSKLGQPYIGPPPAFSFNIPTRVASGVMATERADGRVEKEIVKAVTFQGGMCPRCTGRGVVNDIDVDALLDKSKSLSDGAILIPGYKPDGWLVRIYSDSGLFDPSKPIGNYSKRELDDLLYKTPSKINAAGINLTYEGLVPKLQKGVLAKDPDALQPHMRAFVDRVATFSTCPDCGGTRLTAAARSSKIAGYSIADLCRMEISDLAQWFAQLDLPDGGPLLDAIRANLDGAVALGLGYLTLDRPAGSLSGGEAQRIKMLRHLGSALTDVTYVFDEPSIGLHPADIERLNQLLVALRDKGNTVFVVEHKPEIIAIADQVVDLGPGAGAAGGQVCYQGDLAGLRTSDTATGRHLADVAQPKPKVREAKGHLEIRDASTNNLQGINVDLPLGVLTVITGVAGSGKSSLVSGSVAPLPGVVVVDQSGIRGSRRSNPATYTGLLDPIRKAFAKASGQKPALFSPNSEGACPMCNGAGVIYTELGFLETVASRCEECGGRRFQASVLDFRLGGKNISEVLSLSVSEAAAFFASTGPAPVPAAHRILARLADVGLGYLSLGQPLTTLSGGERQRLKLAVQLGEPGEVYVLDEPTTGLHLKDISHLLALLDRLVDHGKTVVVIEHHQAVMAHADWLIDLGPGAGSEGGRVVFEGTPAELIAARSTLTGEYLAKYVAGAD